jgi:hypothetical protein
LLRAAAVLYGVVMTDAEALIRLSSRQTFWLKRLFPILWAAILVVVVYQVATHWRVAGVSLLWLLPPLLASVLALVVIRQRVADLADEVWDEGESLSVRMGDAEASIPLSVIVSVQYAAFANPQRVTLQLREACEFGREIVFMPRMQWLPWRRHPLIVGLMQRVAAVR